MVFENDKFNAEYQDHLNYVLCEITELEVQVILIGIGEQAKLSELIKIASENTMVKARHFGEYEAPITLGKAIIQGKRSFLTSIFLIS